MIIEKIKQLGESIKRYPVFTMGGCVVVLMVILSMILIHNIENGETSDERLWKDKRIVQYWTGMRHGFETGDWSFTYINDKPGVTLAAVSGLGLPYVPDPTKQEISKKTNGKYLYRAFKAGKAERINFGLRLPIVAFTVLMIGVIGTLLFIWTHSASVTLLSVILVAFSPVLMGISRILNPDAVLWTTSTAAIIAYLIALYRGARWTVILAGILFGLALLSKYTATLLTIFFLILLLLSLIDVRGSTGHFTNVARARVIRFFVISFIGYAIFAIGVPAVIANTPLFLRGTILSRALLPIALPLYGILVFLVIDILLLRAQATFWIMRRFSYWHSSVLRIGAGLLCGLFFMHIINAQLGAPLIPLNDLRETVESSVGSKDSQIITLIFPMAEADGVVVSLIKKILVESASTFFSLSAPVVIILIIGSIWILWRGHVLFSGFSLFALTVPWIFFIGGLMADVFVNVRYAILLHPILSVLAAILLVDMIGALSRVRWRILAWSTSAVAVMLLTMHALVNIAPFYLNYQNFFLPRRYSLADSWSYGLYEAAQWLNQQPDAKSLKVWSDRQALCRYIVGKCVRSSKIDRTLISPEYFIVTRRNVIDPAKHFVWIDESLATRRSRDYYSEQSLASPVWELHIGGRPTNYVKIIRSDDADDLNIAPPVVSDSELTNPPVKGGGDQIGNDAEEWGASISGGDGSDKSEEED